MNLTIFINRYLGPPLRGIGWMLGKAYRFAFGWLDIRVAEQNRERLERDVRNAFWRLFKDEATRFVPTIGRPFPPGFDYAFVSFQTKDLVFTIGRGRGELGVSVAPLHTPEWETELRTLLNQLLGDAIVERGGGYYLQEAAKLVETHYDAIISGLSPETMPSLKEKLREVYKSDRNRALADSFALNQRIYAGRKRG